MIRKLKPKSEFSRNILTLITGSVIAQAIPIAASPILTRIYTPQEFGLLSLYIACFTILAIISTGRYELAIMLPKKDNDALNMLYISVGTCLIFSLIVLIAVLFFNKQITNLLNHQEISSYLYFAPLSILFFGVYQSIFYWRNRRKEYKAIANSRIIQNTTISFSQLSFFNFETLGLISGNILGNLAVVIFFTRKLHLPTFKINKLKILALLKKYKSLPFFNAPTALADALRIHGTMLIIPSLFSIYALGQFALAWKTITIPLSIISGSVAQAYYQRINSTALGKDIFRLSLSITLKLALFSVGLHLILYFFAPVIFSFVFGENWKYAGEIVSLLTPWLFLNFITAPLSYIYISFDKNKTLLVFSIIYAIIPTLTFYLLRNTDFLFAIKIVSINMSLFLFFYLLTTLQTAKRLHK